MIKGYLILLFLLCSFSFSFQKLNAAYGNNYNDIYAVPRSTIITGNAGDSVNVKITTGQVYLEYYQVLTTAPAGEQLEFYDAALGTNTALRSYLGFPMGTYYSEFPLEINCSSGAYIVNRSTVGPNGSGGGKVRVVYYLRAKD